MSRLESRARLGLVAWAMVVTMARAVRYPNEFAEAHWLLDYRFGFIKRGLAGSIYSLLAWAGVIPRSATAIAILSFTVFGALVAVLLAASRRILDADTDRALSFSATAVFATSPFIVMAAHFMGYLDHLIVLATFTAAWLAVRGRFWPAAVLAAAGVLVHESFLLIGLPLVLVAAGLAPAEPAMPGSAPPGPLPRSRQYLPFVLPLVAAVALFVSETMILGAAVLRQQLAARLTAFPFVAGDMNLFVPEWLTAGTWANVREQAHAFWRHVGDSNLLRLMVPPALFLVVFSWATAPPEARARRAYMGILVVALPLLLHAAAWDTARIWTYTILVAFGFAWLHAGQPVAVPSRVNRLLLAAAAVVLLAGIFGRSPLMDRQEERFSAAMRLFLYAPSLAGTALVLIDGWRERRR